MNRVVELERSKSEYNEVVIEREGTRVDMNVAGAVFATYDPGALFTGYSWDALSYATLLHREPHSILLLGLGGGTVTRQLEFLLPKASIDAVEIDAEIVRLAQTHMALSSSVNVHVKDAYSFLKSTRKKFDVIIDDVYLTGPLDVERPLTLDESALGQMKKRLRPGGICIANLIVDHGHYGVRELVRGAFESAFDKGCVVRPPKGLNEIVVGGAARREIKMPTQVSTLSKNDRLLVGQITVDSL